MIQPNDTVPIRTLPQVFQEVVKQTPDAVALRVKRQRTPDEAKQSYIKWTWKQYYKDSVRFAASLIKFGLDERSSVNLIGFNAPEWAIAFYGTIFANLIPSGVYTTNIAEACYYQADHSEAQLIVVENEEHLKKYLQFIDKLPKIKGIIIYDDDASKLRTKYSERKNLLLGWKEFLALGQDYNEKKSLKK